MCHRCIWFKCCSYTCVSDLWHESIWFKCRPYTCVNDLRHESIWFILCRLIELDTIIYLPKLTYGDTRPFRLIVIWYQWGMAVWTCEGFYSLTPNHDRQWPFIWIHLVAIYSCVRVWRKKRLWIISLDRGNCTTPSYIALTDAERLRGDVAKN